MTAGPPTADPVGFAGDARAASSSALPMPVVRDASWHRAARWARWLAWISLGLWQGLGRV
ncbi:hypothetical protein ABW17_29195 [Mycobacterium nebraskense]|uniref:hypothetical protein n=1 Tax=Mycobacterium nebraskense TaxID=244292 RepID=UPI0006419E0F|nr:hypothetical protein [Mycobacterium nebraskense]KLO30766.1 hypothetical protein ABW17_29195 [Mycobacterium nebraskense]